jgi:ABC-type antimicrobial peptide transport system permease subunit
MRSLTQLPLGMPRGEKLNMDFRRAIGGTILLMLAAFFSGFIFVFVAPYLGLSSEISIGLSIGSFLFFLLVYIIYSAVASTRVGKKIHG